MENKFSYKLQTILVIVLMAVVPLVFILGTHPDTGETLYHVDNTQILKLLVIDVTIAVISIVTLLFGGNFKDKIFLSWKTLKWDRRALTIGFIFTFLSLFQNVANMNLFARQPFINTPVLFGVGPNNLSIFFYWFAMLALVSLIPSWHYLKKNWIKACTVISLLIVGVLISYQVFVDDFIGVSRTYLFGFGNSNYVPDPFALVGLMLVLPFLFSEKVKWYELFIGAFFFFVMLLSLSRAAFVGIGASILVTLIYLIATKRLNVKRTLVLVGLTLIALVGSIIVLNAIGDQGLFNDFDSLWRLLSGESDFAGISSVRVDLWKVTISRMNEDPYIWFLGNGQSVYMWIEAANGDVLTFSDLTQMNLQEVGGVRYIETMIDGELGFSPVVSMDLVSNIHNMYIDVLFSGGIVVLAIFIYLLVKQFIYAVKLSNHDVANVVLLAALVFITVKWMFNSLNAMHSPFILIVFVINTYRYLELKNSIEEISK